MLTDQYAEAAYELIKLNEVRRVCNYINQVQLRFLFLKGTHYAYQYYENPHVRPRLDNDIFIEEQEIENILEIFARLGYEEIPQLNVFNERLVSRTDQTGLEHNWDIHFKLSNRSYFSNFFNFSKVYERKQTILRLGLHCYGLCPVDALIYSAIHDLAHHHNSNDTATLTDLFRIWSQMNQTEKTEVGELSQNLRLNEVLIQKLMLAHELNGVQFSLNSNSSQKNTPFVIQRSMKGIKFAEILFWDFVYLSSWKQRFQFAQEFLWPNSKYFGLKPRENTHFILRIKRLLKAVKKLCKSLF